MDGRAAPLATCAFAQIGFLGETLGCVMAQFGMANCAKLALFWLNFNPWKIAL